MLPLFTSVIAILQATAHLKTLAKHTKSAVLCCLYHNAVKKSPIPLKLLRGTFQHSVYRALIFLSAAYVAMSYIAPRSGPDVLIFTKHLYLSYNSLLYIRKNLCYIRRPKRQAITSTVTHPTYQTITTKSTLPIST